MTMDMVVRCLEYARLSDAAQVGNQDWQPLEQPATRVNIVVRVTMHRVQPKDPGIWDPREIDAP